MNAITDLLAAQELDDKIAAKVEAALARKAKEATENRIPKWARIAFTSIGSLVVAGLGAWQIPKWVESAANEAATKALATQMFQMPLIASARESYERSVASLRAYVAGASERISVVDAILDSFASRASFIGGRGQAFFGHNDSEPVTTDAEREGNSEAFYSKPIVVPGGIPVGASVIALLQGIVWANGGVGTRTGILGTVIADDRNSFRVRYCVNRPAEGVGFRVEWLVIQRYVPSGK